MNGKSIVFIGMKHSGKSTLAGMLAWEIKTRNIDLDTLIEQEYRSDGLISCRDIYRQHGRDFFQDLECRAAFKLAQQMRESFLVASLGGGTVENECAWQALSGTATVVYIVVPIDVLYARIMKGGLPAFLSSEHPYEDFAELYSRRSSLMEKRSDISVHLGNTPIEESFKKVAGKLQEYGYAW